MSLAENGQHHLKEFVKQKFQELPNGRVYEFIDGKKALHENWFPTWIEQEIGDTQKAYAGTLIDICDPKITSREELFALEPNVIRRLVVLLEQERSPLEKKFAKDFIDLAPSLCRQIIENDKWYRYGLTLHLNLGSEANDNVDFWWAVAPYLHDYNLNKSLSDTESIRLLLNWAARSEPDDEKGHLTLDGTEWLANTYKNFALSSDAIENPASHTLAKDIAGLLGDYITKFDYPIELK